MINKNENNWFEFQLQFQTTSLHLFFLSVTTNANKWNKFLALVKKSDSAHIMFFRMKENMDFSTYTKVET